MNFLKKMLITSSFSPLSTEDYKALMLGSKFQTDPFVQNELLNFVKVFKLNGEWNKICL